MDKELISTCRVKAFLSANVENFARFADQVIHDEEFLKCAEELLPFEGMACASMNVLPERQAVRKMGVMLMRMDLEPPLFSLAVTVTTDVDGAARQDVSVFLAACKSIAELQAYVKGGKFREDVVEQCGNAASSNGEPLPEAELPGRGHER